MSNINELDYLMARFNVYYDFTLSRCNDITDLKIYEEHLKKPTEEAYANKNIRFLRAVNKEINSEFVEVPDYYKKQIAILFKEKLGEDIYLLDKKRIKKIEQIKKRGEIKTKAEYILVNQRVEEIFSNELKPNLDEDKASEVALLNSLLATFRPCSP